MALLCRMKFQTLICFLKDHKTDSIIQATLRNELGSDTTVLTIAHRLQTIMDADKIVCCDVSSMRFKELRFLLFRWSLIMDGL
jgi:hypothetical protein